MSVSKAQWRATLAARPLPTVAPSVDLLLEVPEITAARTVATFASMPSEPSTLVLRQALSARGITVLLPVLEADNSLTWAGDGADLAPGRFGLATPTGPAVGIETADVIVVPALAISHSGQRLGRGGGSFDRSLADFRTARRDGLIIAWILERDLFDELPVEAHDVPVDVAVTEGRVLRFTTQT